MTFMLAARPVHPLLGLARQPMAYHEEAARPTSPAAHSTPTATSLADDDRAIRPRLHRLVRLAVAFQNNPLDFRGWRTCR